MGMKLKCITPVLAAGAAAVAIAATPTAFAADQQPCNSSGSGKVCQSPGNIQIKSPLPMFHTTPMETRAICSSTIRQLPLRRTRISQSAVGIQRSEGESVASLSVRL
jgi:hypothetical protein